MQAVNLQPSTLSRTARAVRSLHISAFGIHTGGGLVLLKAILLAAEDKIAHVSMDKRLQDSADLSPDWRWAFVRRSFIARAYDSLRTCRGVGAEDTLLCFNSLPPLCQVRGRAITYVHAPHLVGLHRGTRYRRLTTLRFMIERAWFSFGARYSAEFWVQTESMREALEREHPKLLVRVVPFVDDLLHSRLDAQVDTEIAHVRDFSVYSFIYPADGVGHKNHTALLAAWGLLADQGFFPRLILSLDNAEVEQLLLRAGMERLPNVEARGHLARAALLESLSLSSALLFPSLAETFGLPLLEARAVGVPIIASERDFIRDVCIPAQTFDPTSPLSIARAVQRFLDSKPKLEPCCSAAEFTERLLQ